MESHLISKKQVIGHAQLARAYGVAPHTLTRWLQKIPGLEKRGRNVVYFPRQQEIIFQHLGSPFE